MKNKNKESTRYYSDIQEKHVALVLGGYQNSNSGASKFTAGDVKVPSANMLIECKTCMTDKESFSIRKEWLIKNRAEAFSVGSHYRALAFNFGPSSENHYIINEDLMIYLVEKIRSDLS